jgi:hypothetical protein
MVRAIGTHPLEFLLKQGRGRLCFQLGDETLPFRDGLIDPFAVFVVIRQRGMDFGESDTRMGRYDFVRTQSHAFMPNRDIFNRDAMPIDAWPATTNALGADDSHTISGRPR